MLAFGCVVLDCDDLRTLGRTVRSSALFITNTYFSRTTGDYFSPAAEENPLLNLWSLSVEEQFYLMIPLTLWLLWKFREKAVKPVLWGALGLSFFAAAFHMGHQVVVPDDLLGRKGVYMGLDHCHTCFLACLGPARKLCGHGNAGPAPVRRETGRRHGEAPLTPAVPVLSFLEAGKVKKDAKKCFTKAGLFFKQESFLIENVSNTLYIT